MLFAHNVTKSYGNVDILQGLTFVISENERVAVVGPNGGGKSTILKLLAGEMKPDSGRAGYTGGALGFLRQEAGLDGDLKLAEEMWLAFPEAREVEHRLAEVAHQIESGAGDLDALIERQAKLLDAFERVDGYRIEARIGRVLDGLGFSVDARTKKGSDFSGGWQMRIALAKALVHQPEMLLLDEPTNHLDAKTRDWLARHLADYPGAVMVVAHDAQFLDRVATRILDLRDGVVVSYTGNYSEFQRQKAEQLQLHDRTAARQEREIAKQERFIERFRAKATKATLVQSREKALTKTERVQRTRKQAEVNFRIAAHGRVERDVLVVRGLAHDYGEDNAVLRDVNLHVERGQKVALVGPNGSGKSTLLRLLARQLAVTDGTVEWAQRAQVGYYDQHQDEALDPDCTVLDELRSVAGGRPEVELRSVLGQFLFKDDAVFKPVGVLSGGERSRVALAKFLIQPTNVLLLDEPTNHLDAATRGKLVEALKGYQGTIICASHDDEVVEGVATHVYEVANGECREVLDRRKV